MKITGSLILLGALAVAGGVSAQAVLRPVQVQNVQAQTAPDWFPEMTAMKKRVGELEAQLAAANQQVAQLRGEYSTHTHGAGSGNLVYNNAGAISGFKQNAFVFTTTVPSQRSPSVEYREGT
jgi:hypothetical protein